MNLEPAKKIIREFEGFSRRSYLCPAGKWTIGYGSTYDINGVPIKENMELFSDSDAEALLNKECEKLAERIADICDPVELKNHELCALVSFAYNVGIGNFKKSTLLRHIQGKFPKKYIVTEFDKWVYAGKKKLPGLVRRREAEKALFLKPVEALVEA